MAQIFSPPRENIFLGEQPKIPGPANNVVFEWPQTINLSDLNFFKVATYSDNSDRARLDSFP